MDRHDYEMSQVDAFLALRDIKDDDVEGMLRAERKARDAWIHEGKSFSIQAGTKDLEEAKKFLSEDTDSDDQIEVIDVDADSVEHIKKKEEYVGQAILCCNRCKANRFIDMDLLEASEMDDEVYNIEDECPHCHDAGSGYTLLGQVGKVQKEKPEEETETEAEVENDEEKDEVAFENDVEEEEETEEVEEEPEVETVEDEEEKDGMETDTSEEELDDLELPELGDEINPDETEEDEDNEKVKESLTEDVHLNKYAEEAWMMNRVISSMNNEEAYYSSWLYIWPDGETREDCAYDFGDADSLSDLEQTFNRIYKHYHADGLYAAEPDVLAYAHQTDSKLGLAKIENIEAVKPHVTEALDCSVAGDLFNAITSPEKISKIIILDVADEKEAPRKIFQGTKDDVPMNVMGSPCKSFDVADGYLTCNVDTSCRNTNRPLNKALECFSDDKTDKVLVWDQATSDEVFSGTKADACKQFGDCEFISFETPSVIRVNIINPAILSDEELNGEEQTTDVDTLVKKIIDANNMSQHKVDKPNTNEYWIKQSILDGDDVDLIYEMFVRPTERKSLIREFKQLTGYTNALEEAFEAGYKAANKGKAVVESRSKIKTNEAAVATPPRPKLVHTYPNIIKYSTPETARNIIFNELDTFGYPVSMMIDGDHLKADFDESNPDRNSSLRTINVGSVYDFHITDNGRITVDIKNRDMTLPMVDALRRNKNERTDRLLIEICKAAERLDISLRPTAAQRGAMLTAERIDNVVQALRSKPHVAEELQEHINSIHFEIPLDDDYEDQLPGNEPYVDDAIEHLNRIRDRFLALRFAQDALGADMVTNRKVLTNSGDLADSSYLSIKKNWQPNCFITFDCTINSLSQQAQDVIESARVISQAKSNVANISSRNRINCYRLAVALISFFDNNVHFYKKHRWTCWFDGEELGTVVAASESGAYKKMEQQWPEYNYSEYDGIAEVELIEGLNEDLNEAVAPKGNVDFEYTDLEVTIQGPKRDVDDWDEETFIDKYTYTVDRNQVATDIWENFFTEDDADIDGGLESLEVDTVWYAFLERRLDDLIEKYYDQLLEFYREAAAEEYVDKYYNGMLEAVTLDDVKAEVKKGVDDTSDDKDDTNPKDDSNDTRESLTEGKIIDAVKKVATRVGADASTIVRCFTELGEMIVNIGNDGEYKSTKLNDLMTHVENKAVLKALLSGNEKVMNGLSKEDIEELEADIKDYQTSKKDESYSSFDDVNESYITEGKLVDAVKKVATRVGADAATIIRCFTELGEMIANAGNKGEYKNTKLNDLMTYVEDKAVLKALLSGNEKVMNGLTKEDIEDLEADIKEYQAAKKDQSDNSESDDSVDESLLTEGKIVDAVKKVATRVGADASTIIRCFTELGEMIANVGNNGEYKNTKLNDLMTHVENKAILKALLSGNEKVMNGLTKEDIEELEADIEDYQAAKKDKTDSSESVRSFKTRKELAEAVEECKNNSKPYTIRRSTVEGYRYDLVETVDVKVNITEDDETSETGLIPAQTSEIEVVDGVEQEFPAAYTPEQQMLLDQIHRVAVDIATAIKHHYDIDGDPALIVADIIRDLQLISGDISVDDLGDSGIDVATKELFKSYNNFYDFVDTLISEITGEEFVTTREAKIRQAIQALHGPEFRTENIDRMIGSRAFIAAAQSGQVPYIDQRDIPRLTEVLETKEFEEDAFNKLVTEDYASEEGISDDSETVDINTEKFDEELNEYFNRSYNDTVMYTTTDGHVTGDGTIVLEGMIQLDDVLKPVSFTLTPEQKITEEVSDKISAVTESLNGAFTVTNNLSEEKFEFRFKD